MALAEDVVGVTEGQAEKIGVKKELENGRGGHLDKLQLGGI